MRVALRHNTTYSFDRSVTLGPHDVRLHPAYHCRVPIVHYALRVQPPDASVRWYWDAAGNRVAQYLFPSPTSELQFDVELVVDLEPFNAFDFLLEPWAIRFPFRYPDGLAADLTPLLNVGRATAALSDWVERIRQDLIGDRSIDTIELVVALNRRVHRDITYAARDEQGVQSPEETLLRASGSCRDTSWLLIQTLRQLGLAARFVSGYQIDAHTAATQRQDQMEEGAQSLRPELHAWTEVYLPGGGWIGLDPTLALVAAGGHVPLAVARTPEGSAPVVGSASPSETRLTHRLEVEAVA